MTHADDPGQVTTATSSAADRADTEVLLSAAVAGDAQAFRLLTAPHRRELLVHCYRVLGSVDDADDALQETLLKAWRSLAGFEGRSTLRARLYRIATNVCLDALDHRDRRILSTRSSARPTRTCPHRCDHRFLLPGACSAGSLCRNTCPTLPADDQRYRRGKSVVATGCPMSSGRRSKHRPLTSDSEVVGGALGRHGC